MIGVDFGLVHMQVRSEAVYGEHYFSRVSVEEHAAASSKPRERGLWKDLLKGQASEDDEIDHQEGQGSPGECQRVHDNEHSFAEWR